MCEKHLNINTNTKHITSITHIDEKEYGIVFKE